MLSRKKVTSYFNSNDNYLTLENELQVLGCIVGIGIYTLKMADTGNYLKITGGK